MPAGTDRRLSTWIAMTGVSLIALAMLLMPSVPRAQELGRLFLTPEQRTELERRRNGILPPPVVAEKPQPTTVEGELPPPVQELGASKMLPDAPPPEIPPITVNGVVLRANGQGTAWVNGQNTLDGDFSADNIQVDRPRGRSVLIRTPENLPDVPLKPGQTYNPSTNTIVEPYDRTN